MPWNPDGTRKKSSSYKMKYQGNTSAFPFKFAIIDPICLNGDLFPDLN